MRVSYAREKFGVAVANLATGTTSIQKRIWDAYMSFHTLDERDFPEELKEDWRYIYNTLTAAEPTYDDNGQVTKGKVENSLEKMSEEAAVDLAQKIVDLNYMLHLD